MNAKKKPTSWVLSWAAAATGAALLSACAPAEREPAEEMPEPALDTAPPAVIEQPTGPASDPATLRRHGQEMDSAAARMRIHLSEMRQTSPEEWHARMDEHARHTEGMLATVDGHLRAMGVGRGIGDERMGAMMGMSGGEYRALVQDLEALRADLDQLRGASEPEVRQRMPQHLDRLDRVLTHMEGAAAHMRGR